MSDLTKKALAEALKNRLSKTTLKNITIKDLTDDCGLNRQTFYYHFRDIYDLMEWTLENDIRDYLSDISDFSEDSLIIEWKESIYHLYQFLYSRKKQILHAYDPINKTYYENFLLKFIIAVSFFLISIVDIQKILFISILFFSSISRIKFSKISESVFFLQP